jgi:hypothetical protein
MRPGETMMNSFMFNVMLLLIASVTVVGLCSTAFALYGRLTAIDSKKNQEKNKKINKNEVIQSKN